MDLMHIDDIYRAVCLVLNRNDAPHFSLLTPNLILDGWFKTRNVEDVKNAQILSGND